MFSLVVFSAGLLATAGLLPLIGVSFAFGLLLVNQELDKFHFIFAGFTFCQVCYLFLEMNDSSLSGGEWCLLASTRWGTWLF